MLAVVRMEPKFDSVVDILLAGLKDEDESVRQYASRGLGEFRTNARARILGLLIATDDDDWLVRSDARSAIQNSAEEAFSDSQRGHAGRGRR